MKSPVAVALALTAAASTAAANGLEIPDHGVRTVARGGAFVARADDGSAVAINPGGLSKQRGFNLTYSHNLIWSHSRFTRAASVVPQPPDQPTPAADPLAPVKNEAPLFPLGVMGALTHDFGLDGWTFGLSVYGPNGSGRQEWPVTGGQRYLLTELEAFLVFYGASVAWGRDDFGIGATVQYADLSSLRYSLVADGTTAPERSPYQSATDVEATLDVSDRFAMTAIVGGWWRPVPWLELGLSGRVVPVYFQAEGDITLANVPGSAVFTPDQLEIANSSAAFDLALPPTARFGVRYRHLNGGVEVFDLEVDVVYEAWSVVKAYDLDLAGQIVLFANEEAEDTSIEKRWRDTLSVRLGGTWAVLPDLLKLSAGGFYEQGAAPENYTHLDFPASDRFGVGGGLEVRVAQGEGYAVDLVAAYSHIFESEVQVDERFGKVFQQRPVAPCPDECRGLDGIPANAGRFQTSYDTLSLGLGLRL